MNNNIIIKITNKSKVQVIRKLIKYNIYYNNLSVEDNNVFIVLDYSFYKEIKRIFGRKNVKIVRFYGLRKYKLFIKKNYITLLSVVLALFCIFILSNMIFTIKIETENRELKRVLKLELEEFGIKKYSFKKSYKELDKIKKHIIKNNKDKLEWIEIETSGTKYTIKVTERKLNKNEKKKTPRSIISTKDAVIKKITSSNGMLLKEVNDYVKKGEVIISGNIIKGEDEVKGRVQAEGEVYGEVWYLVNVEVPYIHKDYVKTGETFNHYYLDIFGKKMSLINYYNFEDKKVTNKVLLEKFYLPFKLYKETVSEYEYKTFKLNKSEAYDKALKMSKDKINDKLDNDEYIIDKKVLKKEYFRSKITLEVFYKVYENITGYGKLEEIKKGSE